MQGATDAGTQDATREVLGNRDLVRHMMSRAHEASRLLSVASDIRNNEECARLFEEWSAKDYPDFDPDACERLWESLDSKPGGFRKLKEYFLYFKENPLAEEWDPVGAVVSNRSKIQTQINT